MPEMADDDRTRLRPGELVNFTGIDSPYEVPEAPELRLDAGGAVPAEDNAARVIEHLRRAGAKEGPGRRFARPRYDDRAGRGRWDSAAPAGRHDPAPLGVCE
jgi:hypothetical protein